MEPAEFDRRWQEGGLSKAGKVLKLIGFKDLGGRRQEGTAALAELLQAADSVPGPLQQQYQQQAAALVQRSPTLWAAGPAVLRASWAGLQRAGLSGSQIAAVVALQPSVLAYNWEGEAKQRLAAWLQQELGLSLYDFLTRHAGYATFSVARLAMRANFLRQHRHGVWQECSGRGSGSLLSLLTKSHFCERAGCTEAELDAFQRAWLATPAGRRWGGKAWQRQRRAEPSG